MLELKNVSKYYNSNGIINIGLRNINLKLKKNEIVAIVGDSGSGKSTLLNVITGVDTYDEGEMYFYNEETSYFNQNDLDAYRKNNVSFIFQNYNIIDSYTVLQNVMIPLLIRGKDNKDAKEEALKIIEKVGLGKRINHKGTKLSGGEKQRCVIARALASDSKILACDEPTGNLDSNTASEIINLIKEVDKDKLVLIVTHNYEQVQDIVTRKIKISDGQIIEDLELINVNDEVEVKTEEKIEHINFNLFLKLAWQNIVSTPKKSIFTILVFLVICVNSLLLLSQCFSLSITNTTTINSSYNIVANNRVIVYDNKNHKLDKDVLDKISYDKILYNNFYEEVEFDVVSTGKTLSLNYTKEPLNYNLKIGKLATLDNEFILVCPKNLIDIYIGDYYSLLNNQFYIDKNDFQLGYLVGIAESLEVTSPFIVPYQEYSQELINYLMYEATYFYYDLDGVKYDLLQTVSHGTKNYISCPIEYKDKVNFYSKFGELYEINFDFEIVYENVESPRLIINHNFDNLPEYKFEEIYEAIWITKDYLNLQEQVKELGLQATVPAYFENEALNIDLLIFYFYVGFMVVALIVIFFIAYVVLGRIYASKNKDYGILRTLGLMKNQLSKITIFELLSFSIFTSIIAYILVYLMFIPKNDISTIHYFLNPVFILCYFIVNMIFSYFLARRFNRRLFKLSVNITIKGEVARND